MKRFSLGLVAMIAGGGMAHAAVSPFAGHWKVDVAKSQFTGDTSTYTKTSTGFEHSSGSVTYAFAIDGKDYPMFPGRTTAWTKTGEGAWDIVFKADGKVLTKAHRALSTDGKSMTTSYTEYRPDGTISNEKDVYQRLSGSTGLAGKWKDVKVDAVTAVLDIDVPSPGAFKMTDPTYKSVIVGKTDGSPSTLTGPTIPPGAVASYKAIAPNKWVYTMTIQSKLFGEGVMAVTQNGKELTDTSWAPGKESEKSVTVYLKQ